MITVVVDIPLLYAFIARARTEREAVAAITQLGGEVRYDLRLDSDGNAIGEAESPTPEWIRNAVGGDLFASPVFVQVTTGLEVRHVAALSGVRRLWLFKPVHVHRGVFRADSQRLSHVTDADLRWLVGLAQLEELDMSTARITDKGLSTLAGLRRIRALGLSDTRITDAGCKQLRAFTAMENLGLRGTDITNAALAEIATLPRLRRLILAHTRISGAGLQLLASAPTLEWLDVRQTEATKHGLRSLSGLSKLKVLVLDHLSDADAAAISGAKNLEELHIEDPRLTADGISRLASLKHLRVLRWYGETLDGAQLESMASIGSLKLLEIAAESIDAQPAHFRKLQQLEVLDVRITPLRGQSIEEIRALLPNCRVVLDDCRCPVSWCAGPATLDARDDGGTNPTK